MKILLTGHKGFIGSNFLKQHSDIVHSTYEWGEPLPNVNGLDWVVHLGAISSTTETDVEKVMLQNYDFSCWLLDECIKYGVKMQFASSASVYGIQQSSFTEDSPVDPRTPYAWSKYMFEKYAQPKFNDTIIQIFRYFNVYGPGEEHKGNQASPFCQFEKQSRENGFIKVFEDSGKYLRDFVHVNEVIEKHIDFFSVKESGIWNIGTGTACSFLDVAEDFDVPIETIPMPENLKNSYQKYTCANMEKTNITLRRYHA